MSESILENKANLPQGWMKITLGDILRLSKKKFDPKKELNQPFVGLEHIKSNSGKIIGTGNSIETKSTKNIFSKGDILYGKLRPYLNKVAVPNFNGVCSTDILVFSQSHYFDSKYIFLFLTTNQFVHFASGNMSGTQHPRIKFEKISKYEIPLPPLLEQHRIISKIESIFSQIDATRNNLDKVKILLKQNRQAVLKAAFEGRLVPQDPNDEPAEVLLKKIHGDSKKVNYDKENIPEGWVECRLEDVTEKILKINPKEHPDQTFQYCDIDSINNNKLRITSPKKFLGKDTPSRARQLIHVNDILFSTVRTYLHNIGIVPLELDNQLGSTGFCVLRNNSLIINRLIFYLVQTDQFEYYLNPLQRGTSYPAVRNRDILNYVFQLSPLNEQKRIVIKIESIFDKIDASNFPIFVYVFFIMLLLAYEMMNQFASITF